LATWFGLKGSRVERAYKEHLSEFGTWDQKGHAKDWILVPENVGKRLCIDETSLSDEVYTIVSNPEGHCGKGTVVAVVKGTKASAVSKVLDMIPESERMKVKEMTMDLSDSMKKIATTSFPKATIVTDLFHVMKMALSSVEELRLKEKREAVKEQRMAFARLKKKLKQLSKQRKAYAAKHPKTYKGKRRGRKPMRSNAQFVPETLSNGDTKVELLTRSKYLLAKTPDDWSESQKERARLLFELYPRIKEAYWLVNRLRCIFRSKKLNRESAKVKLHRWYDMVAKCTLREVKAVRDTIKLKEEYVLNYFLNRSTNAFAESLNSKIKRFRAELRGVSDLPFFIFRIYKIFG